MSMRHLIAPTLLALAVAAFAGCTSPAPPAYTFVASDYAFAGPAEVPAGVVEFHLENEGGDFHHLTVLRIPDGRTYAEFVDALDEGHAPSWATPAGGPNAIGPGRATSAFIELGPGTYAVLCEIPDAEGTPHFAHGMVRELTVMEAGSNRLALPDADVTVRLAEFDFIADGELSGDVTIRVENVGAQPHELTLFRLVGDATTADLLAAFGPNATGPPPGEPMGGIAPIAPGRAAVFEADLSPGNYTMLCFLPNVAGDHTPHFALGMIHEFQVA